LIVWFFEGTLVGQNSRRKTHLKNKWKYQGGIMMKKFVKVFLLLLMVTGIGVTAMNVMSQPLQAWGGQPDGTWNDEWQDCFHPPTNCYIIVVMPPKK
jgi:hypothetical protein